MYKEHFERGITEFNDGNFFASHDTLEEIWTETRGEHRRFLQGLIQSAVGIYHALCGNMRGAESQVTKALEKLRDYPEWYYGVNLWKLLPELEILRDAVRRVGDGDLEAFTVDLVPMIEYVEVSEAEFAGW